MRSDEERLETMRQIQKEARAFDKIDIRKLVGEAVEFNLRSRVVFHAALNETIKENHSFWERVQVDWWSCNTEHIKTCEKCQKLLDETIMHLVALTYEESK